MGKLAQLNVGLVGVAGRGGKFRAALGGHERTRMHAVGDIREEERASAAEALGASA